jgi:hypothetical protein
MEYLLNARILLLMSYLSNTMTEQAVVNDVTRVCRVAYNNEKRGG